MLADPEIGKQFARFRLERLKDRTVDYLRGEFGGQPYKGSDLWISHSHLGVNNHWYDIMMKYYDQQLKLHKVDKSVAAEIYAAVEAMREPIVDPGQKLKGLYLKKAEREAKVAQEENERREADRRQKERARAERIAELRQKREEAAASKAAGGGAKTPETTASSSFEAPVPEVRAATKPKKKAAGVKAAQYQFSPAMDAPPMPIPSSAPSGAELIFRLQDRPLVRA